MEDFTFQISMGSSKDETSWRPKWVSWPEFIDLLKNVRRTGEPMAKYNAMSDAQRHKVKNGPCFVAGNLQGARKKENVKSRSALTLDADFIDDGNGFLMMADLVLGGFTYAAYSTHSHRPHKPKFRLVIPTDRDMSPDEHSAVARKVADNIGLHYFDRTCHDVNRLLYLPSCSKDATPILEVENGDLLCVDDILAEYGVNEEWRNPLNWPRHTEEKVRHSTGSRKADPRTIPGIIGHFNSVYDIEELIAEFLSDVYEPTESSDRYTYVDSSSYGGLIVYNDYSYPSFAYSHHESDPISGMEVSSWDLYIAHKFADLDEGHEDKPPTARPSHEAMRTFTLSLDSMKDYIQDQSSSSWLQPFEALTDDTKLPRGFQEIKGKLFSVKEGKDGTPKHTIVSERKVAITGRFVNVTEGTQQVEVSWQSDKGILSQTVARSMVNDSKKIVSLSDMGLPVHSGNARALAEFLSRFESENEDLLPMSFTSNQMGWVKKGFLIGDDFIGEGDIRFEGMDAGDQAMTRGFQPEGSFTETLRMIDLIRPYRVVKATMFAALAAPMLHLVGMPSFLFELAGETSHGKSIANMLAASFYGSPDPDRPSSVMKTWDATKVFLERLPATLQHLPVFVDDTKKCPDNRVLSKVVYGFSSGQGRGRGSIKGSQIMLGWNTIMLSSGEQKITTIGREQHGGAEARVLCIDEAPFGSKTDYESANFVEMLRSTATENYGHVARPWIKFLAGLNRKELKERLAVAAARYKKAAGDNGVVLRLASLMAVLDLAGQLFDECFYTDMYDEKEMMDLWNSVVKGNVVSDQSEVALNVIKDWVVSEINFFTPSGLKTYGRLNASELAILPDVLTTYLRDKGFMNPNGLIKKWAANGMLICDKGRHTKRVRINSARGYCVVFDSQKIGLDIDETNGVFEE